MYRAIRANKINTAVILGCFLLLLGGLGSLFGLFFGNWSITIWVLVGAAAYALIQYFAASRTAMTMAGGQEIDRASNPRLYRIVENLAITTGTPMPRVFVIDDPAPNAFATGRDPQHAMVAATSGILDLLNDRELTGVMAHELGHVRNYDIRVNMIVFGLAAAVGVLADVLLRMSIFGGMRRDSNGNANPFLLILGLAAAVLAPLTATLVQLAISRQREYLADATGALTTRDPEALASALDKLERGAKPLKRQNSAMAHMYIADPLKPGLLSRLFATHPPIPDRIRRLLGNMDRF
ncbi:MAG: M48 family metallopeptidase [Microbacteriaceae bacterium]|jgi:heat shock protein HtpX|nr:M48 family metallopeptidase [Microbacteriaceae bacterium]